jgi:hypothetical protein
MIGRTAMKEILRKAILISSMCAAMSPSISLANSDSGMFALSDGELSESQGQALLSLGYTAPSGASGGLTDYGYYKLGLEAKMELNVNIRSLQLGCGGMNGPGKCDIDIENLALSGPADGKITSGTVADNGTPTWSKGRANTSALLTNPFIEFAIKNPTSAALREVVGFRLSAEDILGHMSAGTVNDVNSSGLSSGGGINQFSGYIKVGVTPVTASTQQAIFGTTEDQAIGANVRVAIGCGVLYLGECLRAAQTNVNGMTVGRPGYEAPPSDNANIYSHNGQKIWGINVPSQTVSFDFPQTAVTGNRMSQLNLVVRDVPVGSALGTDGQKRIAIGRDSGGISMTLSTPINVLGIELSKATFFMGSNNANGTVAACSATYRTGDCSYITNLKANVTVKENFNLVHNLPITSGGYLSLQKQALRWPGSASAFTYNTSTLAYTDRADNYTPTDIEVMNYGDIAQPGWWLSFKDPLDFGALNPTTGIPMADVLPQLATYITDYLSNQSNRIEVGAGDGINALFGAPLYKGLGDITLANDARAVMILENLLLDGNQKPVPNCFGGLTFC